MPLAGFLSKQQKQEFQECFALLDTDKTGKLSVDNLLSAFQLLSIQVKLAIYYRHIFRHWERAFSSVLCVRMFVLFQAASLFTFYNNSSSAQSPHTHVTYCHSTTTVHLMHAWHQSVPYWYALQAHDSDVRDLIAAVDKQGSGYINYDSFEAVMARSMLQHAAAGESADPSKTVRLQPDSFALPFHEVHLLPQFTVS